MSTAVAIAKARRGSTLVPGSTRGEAGQGAATASEAGLDFPAAEGVGVSRWGSSSFPAASAVLLSEPPGADSNNPPEQGGDGVDAGDGAAAAGQRGRQSRGRRGAVLLSQSSCAWSDQAAKE